MLNMNKTETMKKIKAIFAIVIVSLFFSVQGLMADTNPPNPPGAPEAGDQPIGGGAPIGSGIAILLSLGAGYGAKKLYHFNKEKEELED